MAEEDPRLECLVLGPPEEARFGEYANAFRVMAESQEEVLLDFCLYSPTEQVAKVVSRVRLHRSFLPLVRERLRESILEIGAAVLYVNPNLTGEG